MEKNLNRVRDAYDKYLLVRKEERPRARNLIPLIFDNFIPYKEGFPQDPNIVGGFAELDDKPVFVIGQNWRTVIGDKILTTVSAKGFVHALEIMHLAEKYQRPLITLIDTPGGDPLKESAELLQCWKISDCISTMSGLNVPIISVIIGEGGSGGALALQVADRTYMLENAVFSVISPEGCTGILFKDLHLKSREERKKRNREMANVLRPTPQDMLEFGIIDGIIEEPGDGAQSNPSATAKNIRQTIKTALHELTKESINILLAERYTKYLNHGKWKEEVIREKAPFLKNLTRVFFGRIKSVFRKKAEKSEEPAPLVPEKEPEKITDYKCPNTKCGAKTPYRKYEKNFKVCPECGYIDRRNHPSSQDWIKYLTDRGSFEERDENLVPLDPINFSFQTAEGEIKRYRDDMEKDFEKTGVREALVIGTAKIKGHRVVLAVSEYGFRGGSLSSVVGEKFTRALNYANRLGCPLVSVSMTGGARMQEGIYSLMQMAKTNMALTRRKVPYISVLADPTMAGSLSSYVSQGDIHIAEVNAEIGFAGTRIVEEYLKTRIRDTEGHSPEWYQPDFYLDRGGINEIVHRKNMRERVAEYVELFQKFRS